MKEFGQIVLIKMRNVILEMQVKFPIKISHHALLAQLLFTPCCCSYCNTRAHVNASLKIIATACHPKCSGLDILIKKNMSLEAPIGFSA